MSNFNQQSFDKEQHSDIVGDENFENDDLVTFQHDSKTINLFYSQLTKYSKRIRESYLFSDVGNRFPEEIQKFQEESQLISDNVDYFFQLLQKNYNIDENSILTYTQCIDLLKISKFLDVRKLSSKINQYIKSHNIDADFVIQMIHYNITTQNKTDNYQIDISNEVEDTLSSKINECFSNEKFDQLPIQIIHLVIKKCSPNQINSNKLFDFIMKSMNKYCVLFPFLDLQKLSDDRLSKLCEMYSKSNEKTQHYFDYLKCNLNLINEMNNRKKNLEEMNDEQQNKMKDLETKIASLQTQFNDSNNLNKEQQNKMNDLETKIAFLQNKFNDSEKVNAHILSQFNDSEKVISQLQDQLNDSEKLNKEQQNKMKEIETLLQNRFNEELENQIKYSKELENQISQLQDKITEKEIDDNKQLPFDGQIVASVEKEVFINAEINLTINFGILDTKKSKVIISTSDAKCLGIEAYEKGEPITSLHMQTTFACKTGRYYVRCIVFNTEGESNEIVSNSVTTNGSSLTFDYKERKPAKIALPQGQYMLEVWGAKGGDGAGKGLENQDRGKHTSVPGGLGGYSRGILNLNNQETIYIFVGEQGCTSNSSEGKNTNGGFPDGGGTKTGIYDNNYKYATIPGTGGGSTSIRIGNDTNNARVIVAGGGGGASGCTYYVDPGGFGGGLSGGNCYFKGSLQSQGAGTQTGSTCGLGFNSDKNGDPGKFGLGATGKYEQQCTSGGGGGGGWYGGGGGGYGCNAWCSSGGGGSGWIFTESSLKTFQSGDPSNASKFVLASSYYLSDAICVGGNEEFPRPDGKGNERGHAGHGYAKITLL